MTNAKEEFLQLTEHLHVKCASIHSGYGHDGSVTEFNLPIGYDANDLHQFLKGIDFTYDSGYGGQELYGIIWFKDGTWADRGEYDGSEWWRHNSCPVIPDELL